MSSCESVVLERFILNKMRHLLLLPLVILTLLVSVSAQVRVTGVVTSVESGELFILSLNRNTSIPIKLRLIETPTDDQELYEVVRDHVSNFLLGKTITVTITRLENSYELAVILDGIEISKQMVRDGAAWYLDDATLDAETRNEFRTLENLAKSEKRGIWGVDGLIKPSILRKAIEESKDPITDNAVALIAWQMLGSSVEDVFAPEIYSAQSGSCSGRVVGVSDGDTVTILNNNNQTIKVRLEGIDAPEKSQSCGMRSKEFLSDQIFGKTVSCESHKQDRYGRSIGKISFNGRDINKSMVDSGFAWHYKNYASEQSQIDRVSYSSAESSARSSGLGIWATTCDHTPPWEFRKNKFLATFTDNYYDNFASQLSRTFYYSNSGSPLSSGSGPVQVRGYYRSNGTYVQSHTRRSPRR